MGIGSCGYGGNETHDETFADWRAGVPSVGIESWVQSQPDTISSLKSKNLSPCKATSAPDSELRETSSVQGKEKMGSVVRSRQQTCHCSSFLFFPVSQRAA